MKESPYIAWAKKQHGVKYNLAGSGMPAYPLNKLVNNPAEVLESGEHEDGWPPLIERISERYEVDTQQIVLVSSASFANHLVCALLLEPGDEVLVEAPAYEPLVSVPKYFHSKIIPLPRPEANHFQPDMQVLEEQISARTKLIILSDLHNPTGAKVDENVLKNIIRIAEKNGIFVLIDEVYLEFLYPQGQRTAAKLSQDVITTRSLTKAFGLDDVRIGWIIAEAEMAQKLQRLKDLFSTTLPFPSERLGLAALNQADKLLKQNLSLLAKNFQKVKAFIESEPALSWVEPPAGSVGFVKFEGGNTDKMISHAHQKYETLVVPGRFFGAPDHFRIGWSIPTQELEQGLKNLGKAIAKNNMSS